MNDQKIILSDIILEDNNKEIVLDRKIFIECICSDIEHIGRIMLRKEYHKPSKTSDFSMWVETNAKGYIKRYCIYDKDGFNKITIPFQFLKFKTDDIIRRVKMAYKVLFKDTVYIPLDWELMDDTIPGIADAIKKSYIDMNKMLEDKLKEKDTN